MRHIRCAALSLAACLSAGMALPAQASREGRRNTAIALGAVGAYGIIKKNPTIAGLGTAGALYSYTASLKRDRHRRRRRRNRRVVYYPAYQDRYYDRAYSRGVYDGGYSGGGYSGGPPGWSHGRKTGWGGGGLPPGLAKKMR